jgi:GNAT superfamily N-acetyltransferase
MKADPPSPDADHVVILPSDPAYIDQLVDVQRRGYNLTPEYYDHPEVLTHEKFANHLRVFPEGQFMALDIAEDRVVGTCTSLMIAHDIARPFTEPWRETTADGWLRSHNPDGEWLYGVDNVVLKDYRGKGIGGRLMAARYNVARRLNLRGMIAGSMPIDFHRAATAGVDIEQYVREVVAEDRWDTNLSKQLIKGCRVLNVIPNYLTDSEETQDYGVAIVWHNPDYRAPRRIAAAARRPARPAARPSAINRTNP